MVFNMIKKNWFIIAILLIFILFLSKDHLLGFISNTKDLQEFIYDTKLEYYKEEYTEMQSLLNIPESDYEVTYGKIILRDIYEFYDEITINVGTSSGIKVQDLVINELGVIGVIKEAHKNSSVVELLTNKDMELSVRVGPSYGILSSKDEKIIIKNIKLNETIKEGDTVYTSGLTSIPKDIKIGTIKSISKDNLELEYILEVESLSRLEDINYVAILSGGK